jgi:hypothetical protein
MKSNIAFQQKNSRFSSLKEDIKEESGKNKEHRNQEKEYARQSRQQYVSTQRNAIFDEPKNNQRPSSFRDRIQAEKDKKQADLEKALTDKSSFPELVPSKQTIDQTNNMNYMNKLTWVKEEKEKEKSDDDWLPVGFEKLGQTNNEKVTRQSLKPAPPAVIMKALVDLYENWKKNYINTWGEEEYERQYLFPNYDYEYFDKLDEKYEMEMLKLEEKEREKEEELAAEYEYMDYDNYDD